MIQKILCRQAALNRQALRRDARVERARPGPCAASSSSATGCKRPQGSGWLRRARQRRPQGRPQQTARPGPARCAWATGVLAGVCSAAGGCAGHSTHSSAPRATSARAGLRPAPNPRDRARWRHRRRAGLAGKSRSASWRLNPSLQCSPHPGATGKAPGCGPETQGLTKVLSQSMVAFTPHWLLPYS